jgi:hypothetical protein
MDWHMYLILFIVMILFIGIVLFAQRMKKQPKDPLSVWNPENFSLYFDNDDARSKYLQTHNDTEFDPAFHNLPANVFHNFYHNN